MGFLTLPPLPMFLAKSMSTIFGYTNTLHTLKTVIETSKYPPGIKPRQGIRMGVPDYWTDGDKNNFEQLPADSLITSIEGFIALVNNLNEVQPHYEKLFGKPMSKTKNSICFKLETNSYTVLQPETNSGYEKIIGERGEGIQILIAKAREKNPDGVINSFTAKGFTLLSQNNAEILFFHAQLPFQIQIML